MSDLLMPEPVALGPTASVPGRPFTDVALVERDRAVLREVLGDVCDLVTEAVAGTRRLVPYEKVEWYVDGLVRRHIVCIEDRLRSHPKLCVVGFFGERRTEIDATPLDEANEAVVAEFTRYPGITSYGSLELSNGNWANLVLHDDPVDTEYWRRSELHVRAASELARVHYRTVRIYNGQLTAPLFEEPAIDLRWVKYFDFTGEAQWRATRTLMR